MKDLETMQREGREKFKQQHNFEVVFGQNSMAEQSCESFLDQHTANTWKAAQESICIELQKYQDESDNNTIGIQHLIKKIHD